MNIAPGYILALWEAGLKSDQEVKDWASDRLALEANPDADLIELAIYGPRDCLKRSSVDFKLRAVPLSFGEEFRIRADRLSIENDADADRFCSWVVSRCIAEDLADPIVKFSYLLDHLISDCFDPKAARDRLRAELASVLSQSAKHNAVTGSIGV
jgi:hypothetical protein